MGSPSARQSESGYRRVRFPQRDTSPKDRPIGRVCASPTLGRLRDAPSGVSGANGFREERHGQSPHLGACARSPRYRGGTGRRSRSLYGVRGQPGRCHQSHRRGAARRRRCRRRATACAVRPATPIASSTRTNRTLRPSLSRRARASTMAHCVFRRSPESPKSRCPNHRTSKKRCSAWSCSLRAPWCLRV